jgi:hypothetical protein
MLNGRHRYFREAAALIELAAQTDDPRKASELVKQASDILALVAEFERGPSPSGAVR